MLRDEVNILVIEDVSSMRTQIRMILKSFGFRKITLCENAAEGVRLMDAEQFNLILCDWHLGSDISGLDFLKFVREHPTFKDVGFIMVTAESTRESVIEAIRSGVDDYLIKPLTLEQIESKVYGVLMKKRVLQ